MKNLLVLFLVLSINVYSQYDMVSHKSHRDMGVLQMSASLTSFGIGYYIYSQPAFDNRVDNIKYTYTSVFAVVGVTCTIISVSNLVKARRIKRANKL
jgi:hypothetical protein